MTAFNPPIRDLVTLLADAALRHGVRPLIAEKQRGRWVWTSYAEFARKVDECRAGFATLGVQRGDRVAVISGNSLSWAVGAYASFGLGAIYVPMYEAQQDREREYILKDCAAKICLVSTQDLARRVEEMRPSLPKLERVICIAAREDEPGSFAGLVAAGARSPHAAQVPDPAQIACIVYTSGTTGKPKGVVLSHSNIACNVAAGLAVFHLAPDDRSLAFLPWAHLFGQAVELHTIIGAGASTALCEGLPHLMDNLLEVRPTLLVSVPAIYNRLYAAVRRKMATSPAPVRRLFEAGLAVRTKQRHGEPLSMSDRLVLALARRLVFSKILERFGGRLRFAVSAGAALSQEVASFVDGIGVLICEGYGLTETSPGACLNTPTDRRLGSVGRPIPGVTVSLDESAGTEPGEGELLVRGHNVMQGYHALPEETARVLLPDGTFRTGDLARIDGDGYVYITGRVKELFKLDNGKYIAPAALEEKLALSLYVSQVLVTGANRPFTAAIVVPDLPALKAWAEAQGIDASNPARLVQDPRVRALMKKELDAQSTGFKAYERIRGFVLTAEEFSVANDLLTPKLSMKRRNIVRRYQDALEALYAREAAPPPERPATRPPEAPDAQPLPI